MNGKTKSVKILDGKDFNFSINISVINYTRAERSAKYKSSLNENQHLSLAMLDVHELF